MLTLSRLVYLIYVITSNFLTLIHTCSFHMNDVIKYIQQGIINCNYLDMSCPCHTCHIYEIWRSKEVRDPLKSSFGMTMQASTGGRQFELGSEVSHYVILLYWNFIVSLTGYCKRFYRIPLFPIFLLFYMLCIYWDWQGQKCKLKWPV